MAKHVVTKVTVRKEASVSKYLKNSTHKKDLKELLRGVANLKNWSVEAKGEKIVGAHPTVDKHPGHIHGKDWKLNIEASKQTVDRLMLTGRKYKTVPNKRDPSILNVEISCNAFVETDTH